MRLVSERILPVMLALLFACGQTATAGDAPDCSGALQPDRVSGLERPAIELDWGRDEWLSVLLLQGRELVGQSMAEPDEEAGVHRLLPGFLPPGSQGGLYRVLLVGEHQACDAGEVEVQPTLGYPGMSEAALNLSLVELELLGRLVGTDLDGLRQRGAAANDPMRQFLAELAHMLDGQGNPRSVRARLAALESDSDPVVREAMGRIDALIFASGLLEQQSERIQVLAQVLQDAQAQRDPAATPPNDPLLHRLLAWAVPSAQAFGSVQIDPSEYANLLRSRTPAGLARMMEMQMMADIRGRPGVGIYRDLSGLVAQVGFTGINTLSGESLQGLQRAGEAYNGMLMLWSQIDKLIAGLYPSGLRELSVEAEPRVLREPAESLRGALTKADVVPVAKGVDLGKMATGALLQSSNWLPFEPLLAGGARFGGQVTQAVGARAIGVLQSRGVQIDPAQVGAAVSMLRGQIAKRTAGFSQTAGGAAIGDVGSSGARWAADNLGGDLLPDMIVIPPFDHWPVSILEPGFYQATSSSASVLALGVLTLGQLPYQGGEEGQAILTVQTMPGAFPNAHVKAEIAIDVERDGARWIPPLQTVVPGATTVFELVAGERDRADFEPVLSSPLATVLGVRELQSAVDATGRTQRRYEVRVQAPARAQEFPVRLSAMEQGTGRRLAEASLVHPKLTPRRSCIEPGEQIEVDVDPPLDADPAAAARLRRDLLQLGLEGAGTLSEWRYSAPLRQRGGKADLVLRSKDGEELDRLGLQVGCDCYWRASAGGQRMDGRVAHLLRLPGPEGRAYSQIMLVDPDRPGIGMIMLEEQPLVAGAGVRFRTICSPTAPLRTDRASGMAMLGNHETFMSWLSGVDGFQSCPDDSPGQEQDRPPPSPVLLIERLDPDWIEGKLDGEFLTISPGASQVGARVPVSIAFRARQSTMDLSALRALGGAAGLEGLRDAGPQAAMAVASMLMSMGGGELCAVGDED